MNQSTKMTTDHEEIRHWVEDRGGKPATIHGTPKAGEDAGLLRIDFPGGASNPPLEPISWESFFDKFDEADLVMVYQDEKADGGESHFCKFVSRETAQSKA
jgi:hypothetical protein